MLVSYMLGARKISCGLGDLASDLDAATTVASSKLGSALPEITIFLLFKLHKDIDYLSQGNIPAMCYICDVCYLS
jgi:hypothetical protein